MSAKILETEKNTVTLEFNIPKDIFQKAIERAYKKNKKHFTIQGFRKGKAPRKIIEAHYGKGIFWEEAIDFAFPDAYRAAVEESDLDVITQPILKKIDELSQDGATLTVEVGVRPTVTLGEYKGLEINPLKEDITQDMIAGRLKAMQNQNARQITVDDAAKEGDTVVIDYEGFMNDEPFEGGKDTDYSLELGSHTFIPGFEEGLIGAKADTDVDVKLTFPEEYHADNLAGQDAVFKVHVHEVQRKELPDLDDEFAKDVSEFDTLQELTQDVADKLQKEQDQQRRINAENKVIEEAVANAEVDIPDALVEEEANRSMQQMEQQIAGQGMSFDDFLKYTGSSREQYLENLKPDAERNIKADFVLNAIANAEDIKPTEEELDKEIKDYADAFNHDFESYKASLDENTKTYIEASIVRRKTVDFLVENAVETKADEADDTEKEETEA
ncbi:MAG: trigger factor [Eubacteriaceae bacterium]|nr:trigger factor [Eubacteriaceae bacterium]